MQTDPSRARWLRRAAAVAVAALVAGACGAGAGTDQTIAGQSAPGSGVIDTVRPLDGGKLEIVGWVASDGPRGADVRIANETIAVGALERRPDLSTVGVEAYRFSLVIDPPPTGPACLVVDGIEVDCVRLGCVELFDAEFRQQLRDTHPDPRWSVAVTDLRTGCEYGVRAHRSMTSASVIKIQFLGGLAQQAAEEGRRLSATELRLAEAMMHYSLNPETAAVIGRIGNNPGLERLDSVMGAVETQHVSPFGATLTTAADRTRVAIATLHGDSSLDGAAVEMAREVAAGLHPAQAWGVSAGVPGGHDVLLKNGFFPLTGRGWRVASSGVVTDPFGGAYAITILTDTNDTQLGGIEMVEAISRHVAERLTDGVAAERPFDDIVCIDHPGGGSWTGLALQLGLSASEADEVRRVAGGDGPMRGQLVCRP
ncbi:MAG: serine hydrolase [Actinomycetota bacterium]